MRKILVVGIMACLVIGLAASSGFAALSFRVYGGYSMLSPGDYNDYIEEQLDWWLDASGAGAEGSTTSLSSAIPLGADVMIGGNPGVMFSLGFTRFAGTAGYAWENVSWGEEMERKDNISVIGGLASVLYAVGEGSSSLYFGGGAGYYRVTLNKTLPVELFVGEDEYKLIKNQLGYHGMVGYRYHVSSQVAVVAEVLYRVLNVKDMEITESDIPATVGETWWGPDIDLGGINILIGAEFSLA